MTTSRKEVIDTYRRDPAVTVLIIGAGINGIGTFRDLALQGVDVLIVDKGDFCAGASAASSHMVHGGIRYLENGEFRLVREAVHERNRLLANAPHLVQPLPTNIPIFKTFSGMLNAPLKFVGLLDRPAERGRLVIKLGLMMYDAYTREQGGKAVPSHQVIGRDEALRRYPAVNPDITALATYYDAAMPMPERIAMEVLLDGERAHAGAHALNYVTAVAATESTVTLQDEVAGSTFEVRPDLVINAAGPWIDFVNEALGRETTFIGGTKGSHLVLNHPTLYEACRGHEFFFENEDGRIVLIYPVNERIIVGTSDIKVESPEDVICTDKERDYFLQFINRIFPDIDVSPEHIVFTFAGVRPLPSSDAKRAGQISRDHSNEILEKGGKHTFPIFNLIGGKWTTFRAFAEHVADDALDRLGVARRITTRNMPIGGGLDYPVGEAAAEAWVADLATRSGLSLERAAVLFRRYGTRAREIAAYLTAAADRSLPDTPSYSEQEIAFLVENEKVVHLEDLLLRRTALGLYGYLTPALVEATSRVAAGPLGWDEATRAEEVDRLRERLAGRHRVTL